MCTGLTAPVLWVPMLASIIILYILTVFPTQDPSTIEHETAASGVIYTLVDKPKRSSKKEGGPDVVPPASEGVSGGSFVWYSVTIFCSIRTCSVVYMHLECIGAC